MLSSHLDTPIVSERASDPAIAEEARKVSDDLVRYFATVRPRLKADGSGKVCLSKFVFQGKELPAVGCTDLHKIVSRVPPGDLEWLMSLVILPGVGGYFAPLRGSFSRHRIVLFTPPSLAGFLPPSPTLDDISDFLPRLIRQVRLSFYHEYVHYLDYNRIHGAFHPSVMARYHTSGRAYVSSGVELNAYFHQHAENLRRNAPASARKSRAVFVRWALDFLRNNPGSAWYLRALAATQNYRRFVNRLSTYYDDVIAPARVGRKGHA